MRRLALCFVAAAAAFSPAPALHAARRRASVAMSSEPAGAAPRSRRARLLRVVAAPAAAALVAVATSTRPAFATAGLAEAPFEAPPAPARVARRRRGGRGAGDALTGGVVALGGAAVVGGVAATKRARAADNAKRARERLQRLDRGTPLAARPAAPPAAAASASVTAVAAPAPAAVVAPAPAPTPTPTPTKKKRGVASLFNRQDERAVDLEALLGDFGRADAGFIAAAHELLSGDEDGGLEALGAARDRDGLTPKATAESLAVLVSSSLVYIIDETISTLSSSEEDTLSCIASLIRFIEAASEAYEALAPGEAVKPVKYAGAANKAKLEAVFARCVACSLVPDDEDGGAAAYKGEVTVSQDELGMIQSILKIRDGQAVKIAQELMGSKMQEWMAEEGGGMPGMGPGGDGGMPDLTGELEQLKQAIEGDEVTPDDVKQFREMFKKEYKIDIDEALAAVGNDVDPKAKETIELLKELLKKGK